MKPVILVGPGTGIAPFRAFWQQRYAERKQNKKMGKMWLFFGCRQKEMDLYRDEKANMLSKKVLDKVYLALSREGNIPKVLGTFQEVKFFHHFVILDLRTRFGSKGIIRNLQNANVGKRSFLRLR